MKAVPSEKTVQFLRDLDWPTCSVTTYDGLRHSLEFEGDPEVYFRDLVAFIDGAS